MELPFEKEEEAVRSTSRQRLLSDISNISGAEAWKRTLRRTTTNVLLAQHTVEDLILKTKDLPAANDDFKTDALAKLRATHGKLKDARNLQMIGINHGFDTAEEYYEGDGAAGIDADVMKTIKDQKIKLKSEERETSSAPGSPLKRKRDYKKGRPRIYVVNHRVLQIYLNLKIFGKKRKGLYH